MSHVIVKFPANVAAGSDAAKGNLVFLPSSIDLKAPRKEVMDACRKVIPSMLARCPDPRAPRAAVHVIAHGAEFVVPVGYDMVLSLDMAHFIFGNAPKGLVELGGPADMSNAGLEGAVIEENNRLKTENTELTGRLEQQGLKLRTVEEEARVHKDHVENLTIERDRLKGEILKLEKTVLDATEKAKAAETLAAEAKSKSKVPALEKRVAELEAANVELAKKVPPAQ